MLSHKKIWSAIDALAARRGHSPSGLAKAAGLDPTTFNKSKRHGPEGRLRWRAGTLRALRGRCRS
jgi:phage repressor protein C with HTH and peptisase S24 domain